MSIRNIIKRRKRLRVVEALRDNMDTQGLPTIGSEVDHYDNYEISNIIDDDIDRPYNDAELVDMYGSIIDPDTGFRFAIPMLNPDDKNYMVRYSRMMWLREKDPSTFEKMMNWE